MFKRSSRLMVLGLATLGVSTLLAAEQEPATRPQGSAQSDKNPAQRDTPSATTSDQPAPEAREIRLAIAQLGDDDPRERDAAAARLAKMGAPALPLLRRAAAGDDPQIAAGAHKLLYAARFDFSPATPGKVMKLVDLFRDGSPSQRQMVIVQLNAMGVDGYVPLAKLRHGETDPVWRAALDQALESNGAARVLSAVTALINQGHVDEAQRLLADASVGGASETMRSWAALLLARGRLDQGYDELRADVSGSAEGAGPDDAALLVVLARARGDDDAVLRYADRIGKDHALPPVQADEARRLREEVYRRRLDWKALLAATDEEPGGDTSGPQLLRLAERLTYARLAGQASVADAAAALLVKLASQDPNAKAWAASILLHNDRIDAAIRILSDSGSHRLAYELLWAQGRYDEAMKQVEQSKSAGGDDRLELESARNLAWLGETDRAAAIVDRYEKLADASPLGDAQIQLIDAELALKRNPRACVHAAAAAAAGAPQALAGEAVAFLFAPRHAEAAERWIDFLTHEHPQAPPGDAYATVQALFSQQMPPAQAESLLRSAADNAEKLRDRSAGDLWFLQVAETAHFLGRDDLADAFYNRAAAASAGPLPWERVGDLACLKKDWQRAIDCFQHAVRKQDDDLACQWLHGWATLQSAPDPVTADWARSQMRTAKELLLASESARLAFDNAVADAGADAEPLRVETRRLCEPGGVTEIQSLYRSASAVLSPPGRFDDDGDDDQNPAPIAPDAQIRAADLTLRWSSSIDAAGGLSDNGASMLANDAQVHSIVARGLLARNGPGDADAAARLIEVMQGDLPLDTQLPIDLVPALRRAGRKAQADALFDKVANRLKATLSRYPNCPEMQNNLAWMCAKCDRDLDAGLAHAERAVQLAPDSVAYLDTLAEVHFHRGETAAAIEAMKKCLQMEPNFQYLHRQLERFEKAAGGRK